MTTATLPQFQKYVWETVPLREAVVGRAVVDDLVMIAVQQWPVEALSDAPARSEQEAEAMHRLAWDVRRMMELLYGHEKFVTYWIVSLRSLVPHVLEVIRTWWRRRKDNRAKIVIWRRKWCNG